MRVFSSTCTFDYSWEEVSAANWRKYCPWNDKSTHVVAVDTLSRAVDADTGILRTERLITCNQSVPQWVLSLFGGSATSHVYEVSYVDPVSKKVTMCSTNLTWSNVLNVKETVIYQPSPSNPSSTTDFNQEAKITALCGGWQKIKNKVEEASVERFSQNAKKGREGFEAVLEMSRRVFSEQREFESTKLQS
ncbi:putative mitochondrial protein sorting (Msf1) [Aspergillus neoniger CBS 115656]|uniref:Mitochondrial protein sorting n=1 Tax=Aspergillus neoniger (strain CBS 115656) TaxID=1448310 RepID=A0A318Y665_ASPNB|nr:mitochondrial protein sorting [Aspergillus neoniger CBS 115656]PYH29766.1 mitochondrial protein sorting [Aspergillus neoniger CBS 115656]